MPELGYHWLEYGLFWQNFIICLCKLRRTVSGGKREQKKHCRPRKCYFQHGCLRPKDEATVFPPRQEKVLFKQPHFGGRFLKACQPFKEGIFSSLQDKWNRLFSSRYSAKYMQNLLDFKPTNAWRPHIRSSIVNYTGIPKEGFLLNASKTLFRLSRVLLDIKNAL